MAYGFLDIAVTPSVRAAQQEMGASHLWEDFKATARSIASTPNEAAFISARDSFYMATVSEPGGPISSIAAVRRASSSSSTSARWLSRIIVATVNISASAICGPMIACRSSWWTIRTGRG